MGYGCLLFSCKPTLSRAAEHFLYMNLLFLSPFDFNLISAIKLYINSLQHGEYLMCVYHEAVNYVKIIRKIPWMNANILDAF
jgi:hypothetical protein